MTGTLLVVHFCVPHSPLYSTVCIHNEYLVTVNGVAWQSHQKLYWKQTNQKTILVWEDL